MSNPTKLVDDVVVEMTDEEVARDAAEKAAFRQFHEAQLAAETVRQLDIEAHKAKAVQSGMSDAEIDGIKDLKSALPLIKKLFARVEYLEKRMGIDHSKG